MVGSGRFCIGSSLFSIGEIAYALNKQNKTFAMLLQIEIIGNTIVEVLVKPFFILLGVP